MSGKKQKPTTRTNDNGSTRRSTAARQPAKRKNSIAAIIIVAVLAITGYWGATNIFDLSDSHVLADGEAAVHYIDVGQGDSVLIQTTQGSVLIDGGDTSMGARVVEYLKDAGVSEIAYVIATHPHADHIGGLIAVLGEFPVGTLIMPNVAHTTVTFERFLDAIEANDIPLREPVADSSFSVGEAIFTIIAPNSENYQDLNNYSVSLRMVAGSTAFIFTGDAEALSETEMLRHDLSADILYVGHHGSRTSTTQDFLDAVNPSVAVISAGEGNSYNHPNEEVLERLESAGVRIYRTDYNGNIVMVTDGTDISIRSQFDGIHN